MRDTGWRLARALLAGALGAGALGVVSGACNALSGIDSFTVGDGAVAPVDREAGAAADGASPDVAPESPEDSPAQATDTGPDGRTRDARAKPDAPDDAGDAASEAIPASDAAEAGTPREGGASEAGDSGGAEVGTGPCDGGTALVVHSNGLGDTFSDCVPLGTFDQMQAMSACLAHTGDAGACTVDPVTCGGGDQVCGQSTSMCACWRYNGTNAGHVDNAATCNCLGSSTPTWN